MHIEPSDIKLDQGGYPTFAQEPVIAQKFKSN